MPMRVNSCGCGLYCGRECNSCEFDETVWLDHKKSKIVGEVLSPETVFAIHEPNVEVLHIPPAIPSSSPPHPSSRQAKMAVILRGYLSLLPSKHPVRD
jgi:hypothetical protein